MAWIELHIRTNGLPIGINVNNIATFFPDKEGEKIYMEFCGNDMIAFRTKESYKEVKELIENAIGEEFYRQEDKA